MSSVIMNRLATTTVSAVSAFALLLSFAAIGCSSSPNQAGPGSNAGTASGSDPSSPSGKSACSADGAPHCAETVACDAKCADNDDACVATCKSHIAAASKPALEAIEKCITDSKCTTTPCVLDACKAQIDACKADVAPACSPASATPPGGGAKADPGTGTNTGTAGGCFPACLNDAFAKCPPLAGACTVETEPGVALRYCYANGSKMRVALDGTPSSFVGCPALAYSTSFSGGAITISDASGTAIGTFAQAGGTHITVTCGGQSYDVDTASDACKNDPRAAGTQQNATTSCTAGSCAVAF